LEYGLHSFEESGLGTNKEHCPDPFLKVSEGKFNKGAKKCVKNRRKKLPSVSYSLLCSQMGSILTAVKNGSWLHRIGPQVRRAKKEPPKEVFAIFCCCYFHLRSIWIHNIDQKKANSFCNFLKPVKKTLKFSPQKKISEF
jgi:hypothetical protein